MMKAIKDFTNSEWYQRQRKKFEGFVYSVKHPQSNSWRERWQPSLLYATTTLIALGLSYQLGSHRGHWNSTDRTFRREILSIRLDTDALRIHDGFKGIGDSRSWPPAGSEKEFQLAESLRDAYTKLERSMNSRDVGRLKDVCDSDRGTYTYECTSLDLVLRLGKTNLDEARENYEWAEGVIDRNLLKDGPRAGDQL